VGREPTDQFDPASLWWRHEVLHRLIMRDPAAAYPVIAPERAWVQARWLAVPPEPDAAFAEADALLAKWTAAVAAQTAGRDMRPTWVRRYWGKRAERAGLPAAAIGAGS
jgi:hypothetical protein